MKNLHLGAFAFLVLLGCGGGGGSSTSSVKSGDPNSGVIPGQDVGITPGMTGGTTSGSNSGSTGDSTPPPVETIQPLVGKYTGTGFSRTFNSKGFTSSESAQVPVSVAVDATGAVQIDCGDPNGSDPVLEAVGTILDGSTGTEGTWQSRDPKTGAVTTISPVAIAFLKGPNDRKNVVLTLYSDEAKTQGRQWSLDVVKSYK